MRLTRLLTVLLGAALYFGITRIGYRVAFVPGTATAVWPATGVALVLVWLGGPRMLAAVFLGELTADLVNGSPLSLSLAFAAGSCGEALAGYALLRRARFRLQLDRVRDVFALLAVAAPLSTIVAATVGTLALLLHGDIAAHDAWAAWHVWWLRDMIRDVVITPLLLVAVGSRPRLPTGWRAVETTGFAVALAGLALAAHQLRMGTVYLVIPVLIWAALRFRQGGAVVANAVLASAAVAGAAAASSPLVRVAALERLLFTQNFVAVGALTTLVLAAVISERDRHAADLRRAEARAQMLADEQTALGEVATTIARQLPLERVLELVVRHAGSMLGARSARIMRLDGGNAGTVAGWGTPPTTAGSEPILFTSIAPGGQDWGHLEVHGLPASDAPSHRPLLRRFADLAELAVVNADARRCLIVEATTDALTGLHNQRAFHRRLSDEVQRSRRYGHPLALVLMDLDGFKSINDRLGHPTGDLALTEVGRRIRTAIRVDAMVARLGGDELAMLLPECGGDEAYLVAERVREAVCASPVVGSERLTISAGIATHGDDQDNDSNRDDDERAMIAAADAALYAAKRMSGNTCVRHTPGLAAVTSPSPGTSDADAAQSV